MYAVVQTGGKQYIVKPGDVIVVDKIDASVASRVSLTKLAAFTHDGSHVELGSPQLGQGVQAEVLEHGKGDKVRVAKFKAKVRYRRVKGFRHCLTKLKIIQV
jgi:large subunit ribosomal protein L21